MKELTHRPLKALRKIRIEPECIACRKPIDLRLQTTGNGWMHSTCEKSTPETASPR